MSDERVEPYLLAAVYCETILQEQDSSVLTVVRIIDRISFDQSLDPAKLSDEAVKEGKFPKMNIHVMLKFASIGYEAVRNLNLKMVYPDGSSKEALAAPIVFEADKMGTQVKILLGISLKKSGRYWLEVNLDDENFTRMPLEVAFQETGSEQPKKE